MLNLDNLTSFSFLLVAVVLLVLERKPALRRAEAAIDYRWLTNLGLMLLSGLAVATVYPASITEVAGLLTGGLLYDLRLPLLLEIPAVFLLLDCWRYWEHRLFHEVPLLWRVHLVHHSDTAIDVTTAQRHHPVEALATTLVAFILVFAMGFSPEALGTYLLLATLSALCTHTNMDLPERIDRPLRRWLVTPAVHAVHHSDQQAETDSNYGSILTVWDRLFGTYTDPASVRVSRYGLGDFRQPEATALGPVLLQPFQYRQSRDYPAQPSQPAADKSSNDLPLNQAWRQALFLASVGLLLALLALWPTLLDLTRLWSGAEAYQYAWLVIPMFVYVVGWYHRDQILSLSPVPGYAGMLVVLAAVGLWLASYVIDIRLGQHIALILILQGIALSSLGWATYRSILPIMFFLFLLVPCGDILQPLLRNLTVLWIEWFAVFMGLPHSIEGYVIYVGTHRYVVIDACSGLSFVTLAGFIGYSLGLLLYRSLAKVIILAAAGAALGVLTNAVRVMLIVGLDQVRGSQMDLAAHMDIQLLVLLAAIASLLFIASRLAHDSWLPAGAELPPQKPSWPGARFAPVLAGSMVLLTVGLAPGVIAERQTTAGAEGSTLVTIEHLDLPGFERVVLNSPADPGQISSDKSLEIVAIHTTGVGPANEQLISPEHTRGWRHTRTTLYRDCPTSGCVDLVHKTMLEQGTDTQSHIFYAYIVGNMVTDSRLAFRMASGWNRLRGYPEVAGILGFRLQGTLPEEIQLGRTFNAYKSRFREITRQAGTDTVQLPGKSDQRSGSLSASNIAHQLL